MGTAFLWGQGGGGLDADGATATPADVVKPYTFIGSDSDELQTGTIEDVTQDLSLPINGKVMIPAGYHDGTGKVKQSLTDNGAKTYTLSANGKIMIPAGWHNGAGKVSQSLTLFGGGTYTPTAAGISIDTANKYLSGNIVAKGDANLKSANIAAKMWGISPGFTPLETAYTLYKDGTYYGWWKDGLVKNIKYSNYDYLRCDSSQAYTPTTEKAKPNPLVVYLDGSTSGNFYIDYGWCGLKTIDLSLFKTITVNFTMASASGAYAPAVQPRIWILSTDRKLVDYETGTNHKMNSGNGGDGTYTDTISIESYTGHHYLAIVFDFNVQNHIAGSSSSHGWSYRKITVNSITLGK